VKKPTSKKQQTGKGQRAGTVKGAAELDEFLYGAFNEPTEHGNDAAFILQEVAFRLKLEAGELVQREENRSGDVCGIFGEMTVKAILQGDDRFFERIALALKQWRIDPKTGAWNACDPLRALEVEK